VKKPEPKVEISLRPMKVIELPIEILVNLLIVSFMDLAPTVAVMRISFFLEITWTVQSLADSYLGASSQEINILVYRLDSSGVELTCRAACIMLELPSMATCFSWKPVPPPPSWVSHDTSKLLPQLSPWPD